jgi:sulfotransferase
MREFVFLSGLPRTGSTLLSAILSQNPKIHAEGNSPLCQLMWDVNQSLLIKCKEQLTACNRFDIIPVIMEEIPNLYYKNAIEPIIIDKCRCWTIPNNFEMIKKYISKEVKIIVLERPVVEIIQSFIKLFNKNVICTDKWEETIFRQGSDPIMKPLAGLMWAKNNNQNNNFLFINYDELVNNPEDTIKRIYEFCNWEYFQHDFENIVVKYPENDKEAYNLEGQHVIRQKIGKIQNDTVLSKEVYEKCRIIDKMLGYNY